MEETLGSVRLIDTQMSYNRFDKFTEYHKPEKWSELFEKLRKLIGPISEFLRLEKNQIYPPISHVYEAFYLCPPERLKVVILGQDPYHGPGQAHGLAFSAKNSAPPPSLYNIYKELREEGFTVSNLNSSDLTPWVEKGVLLLNTALTVRSNTPGSHLIPWKSFSEEVIRYLDEKHSPIFLLWGSKAAALERIIKHSKTVITAHPSPLARGFVGSECFKEVNQELEKLGKEPIDWSL